MERMLLQELPRRQLESAIRAGDGHTADALYDGAEIPYDGHEKVQGQTAIGMVSGASPAEHENAAEATVHVRIGRLRLCSGDRISLRGDRQGSAVLLTLAKLS